MVVVVVVVVVFGFPIRVIRRGDVAPVDSGCSTKARLCAPILILCALFLYLID